MYSFVRNWAPQHYRAVVSGTYGLRNVCLRITICLRNTITATTTSTNTTSIAATHAVGFPSVSWGLVSKNDTSQLGWLILGSLVDAGGAQVLPCELVIRSRKFNLHCVGAAGVLGEQEAGSQSPSTNDLANAPRGRPTDSLGPPIDPPEGELLDDSHVRCAALL